MDSRPMTFESEISFSVISKKAIEESRADETDDDGDAEDDVDVDADSDADESDDNNEDDDNDGAASSKDQK